MTKEIEIPSHFSRNVQDLLYKLLEKDPEKRLGNENGSEEIKSHPWFSSINWREVAKKKIKPFPPYLYKSKEELLLGIGRSKFNHNNLLI